MSPAEVDECEIWQLAVLLGADTEEEDGVLSIEERVMSEADQLKARLAAAGKGVRQETSVEPADGPRDVTAEIMRSMGIATK